jgi:hypothetical protein
MPQAKKKRSTEPDQDERWWAIVVSTDPQLGSGRYGVWANKPHVSFQADSRVAMIQANDEEPVIYINMDAALSVAIGQVKHFDSAPIGAQDAPAQS